MNKEKLLFEFHGEQMSHMLHLIREHQEKKSMKELDKNLASEYPEFVNYGRKVTEEEAKPM